MVNSPGKKGNLVDSICETQNLEMLNRKAISSSCKVSLKFIRINSSSVSNALALPGFPVLFH